MNRGMLGHLKNEIHVWWCHLDQPTEVVKRCFEALSEAERGRIGQYRTDRLRDQHTVARGTLKTLIGLYLNASSENIDLRSNPFGRPYLARVNNEPNLQFSISHSS